MNHHWNLGDHPINDGQAMLLWGECDLIPESDSRPIRLIPSGLHDGSSEETDVIINNWKPKLRGLVDQGNGLIPDLERLGWESKGAFVEATFLGFVEAEKGKTDLRFFVDQALYFLLEVKTSEELTEEWWWEGRSLDARDLKEWMGRLPIVFPKTDSAIRLWSAFMESRIEAFYQYLYGLLREWYLEVLEIVETARENTEALERKRVSGELNLPPTWEGLKEFEWHCPRLFVEGREIWLNTGNAEQIREWGMLAFGAWMFSLSKEQKEVLYDLVHQADGLCPDPRWQ
jgi:hypothetical protein